ncbi:dephospho-CoA kinase [Acinetobacter boissieri]|uniref:Dephospho-CoA kinase n=1 Tax=Acinetobacter boissieri TaxID=1219383 RepID=A0A1G6I1F4_9GAMM|nr:dephospho-CoA kinase [Acinetobacter boissieri]SDC00280.1 dephospho-CoA kinase [Acinetobacter boissieri]
MSSLTIGLTGGIGSGKTVASDWFATQGITVVDADIVARKVVEVGQPALVEIAHVFGQQVILADGSLHRAYLRELIFNSTHAKKQLEQITHPIIRAEIIQQLAQAHSPYCILVSPLLFETDQHQLVQRTLLIDTSEELQQQRASARDQQSIEKISQIISAQMPRQEKQQRANDIVLNTGVIEQLYAQLQPLHQHYLTLVSM